MTFSNKRNMWNRKKHILHVEKNNHITLGNEVKNMYNVERKSKEDSQTRY